MTTDNKTTMRYKCFYMWFTKHFFEHNKTEIANKIGVTKQVISLWTKGRQKPSLESLHNLCFKSGVFADKEDAQRAFDDAVKSYINDIKLAKHKLTGDIS